MARTVHEFKAKHDPATIIADLRAELEEAKNRQHTSEMLREWIGNAKAALHELRPPKWMDAPKKAGAPGVPTIQLSDFHWGEYVDPQQIGGVNAFNLTIARQRLVNVIHGTIKLARILSPKMDYPGIVAPLLWRHDLWVNS